MISVVVPLFNKEKQIGETISSVLSQTFEDFEIVVVDDGSTDGGVDVVRSFSDHRIRVTSQHNSGPSSARNKGVQEAHGKWVLFLDADDILLPNSLAHFSSLIEKYPDVELFCSNHYTRYEGKSELFSTRYKDGYVANCFKAWALHMFGLRAGSGLFLRELLLRYPFDETLRRYEDSEILFRLLPNVKKAYRTSSPTVVYNRDVQQASLDCSNFSKDFFGHLSLNKLSFWQSIVMFQLFYQANRDYPEQSRKSYRSFYKRYDLRLFCRILEYFYGYRG